jgi:hypothetical protein
VLQAGCDAAADVGDQESLHALADLGRLGISADPGGAATWPGCEPPWPIPGGAPRSAATATRSSSCSARKDHPMIRVVRVNRDRFWACLMELSQIGSYHNQATGLPGRRRLTLTDSDAEARGAA